MPKRADRRRSLDPCAECLCGVVGRDGLLAGGEDRVETVCERGNDLVQGDVPAFAQHVIGVALRTPGGFELCECAVDQRAGFGTVVDRAEVARDEVRAGRCEATA